MIFTMATFFPNMEKIKNFFSRIRILSAMKLKQKIFMRIFRMPFEKGFDTSNFPKDHPSGIQGKNKKVPGMMKDEAGGKIIEGFIGLRAKLYSYKMFEGKEENNVKE